MDPTSGAHAWSDDFDGAAADAPPPEADLCEADLVDFADASLDAAETCRRIEALAVSHLAGVLGFLPPTDVDPGGASRLDPDAPIPASAVEFVLPSVRPAGGALFADAGVARAAPADSPEPPSGPRVRGTFLPLRLSDPRRPLAYARVWTMLNAIHSHLREDRLVTQRGLYYLLATADQSLFPTPAVVNACLARDCVGALRCSRRAMGVVAAGRGQLAGAARVLTPAGTWRDCAAPGAGHYDIPGDVAAMLSDDPAVFDVRGEFRYVLVVEKDSVFAKLVQERVWDRLPLALVTAKGFPDLATRVFLHAVQKKYPRVPFLALVDWNPSGLLILRAFRGGARGRGANVALEGGRYALDIKWLGVRASDLRGVPAAARLPLTDLDRAKIRAMLAEDEAGGSAGGDGDEGAGEARARAFELREMRARGNKAEIESLYPVDGEGLATLSEYVVEKILNGDYF